MKKVKQLEIIFDDDCDSFRPGETVQGKAVLDLQQTISVKGIRLIFRGKAEVTIFLGDYDTQEERYFRQARVVFGTAPREDGGILDMEPGHYEYPFSFDLPLVLPNSFSIGGDENGEVTYSVEVVIQRPGKLSYAQTRSFFVCSKLDLNTLPDAVNLEIMGKSEKVLSFLGWKSGTISAVFRLERKGYVPGEQMPLYGCISNSSSCRIKKSVVTLVQYVTLKVHGATKKTENQICRCQRGAIAPGQQDQWQGESLAIPDLPPSYLAGCNLIDIQYAVMLSVVPAGLYRKLNVPLDIVIGTVPLDARPDPITLSERTSTIFDFGSIV